MCHSTQLDAGPAGAVSHAALKRTLKPALNVRMRIAAVTAPSTPSSRAGRPPAHTRVSCRRAAHDVAAAHRALQRGGRRCALEADGAIRDLREKVDPGFRRGAAGGGRAPGHAGAAPHGQRRGPAVRAENEAYGGDVERSPALLLVELEKQYKGSQGLGLSLR